MAAAGLLLHVFRLKGWAVTVAWAIFTFMILYQTDAAVSVMVAVMDGAAIVTVHAAVRRTDDLVIAAGSRSRRRRWG